jgi:hypothetical protein
MNRRLRRSEEAPLSPLFTNFLKFFARQPTSNSKFKSSMRIYIIGIDGITLCREPPTTINECEIVVAANEELCSVRLNRQAAAALWNADRPTHDLRLAWPKPLSPETRV